jgi:hypothetical protein
MVSNFKLDQGNGSGHRYGSGKSSRQSNADAEAAPKAFAASAS